MAELRTRRPTGQVAYPILLVVGEHKKGKSWETYNLANSDLTGQFFAFELGERTADEYASLALNEAGEPLYDIIDHNGTYTDIFEQVKAATAVPQQDGKPNVISLDSGTALWDLHKAYADSLAKRTKRGRELLEADPDAEVETQVAQWTPTKDRWWAIINCLRAWDGIAIITARIDVVAKFENGRPVASQTTRSIQIEKGTPFQMTAVVEASFPNPARLTDIQSLNVKIPDGGLELPAENALEHVIFRIIGAGGAFKSGVIINPKLGVPAREAKMAVLDRAKQLVANPETAEFDLEEAKALAGKAWTAVGLGDEGEITTEQFEAVMAEIEPESEAAPPMEAEDETQVEPEPEPDPAVEPEPEVEESESAEDTPLPDEEPDPVAPTLVPRADAMEILNTVASTIASTPLAAETLVGNVWIDAGHGVETEITEEDLDALIGALQALGEESPVDGATEAVEASEAAQETPAEADSVPAPPAKPVAKKSGAKPAAAPAQETLLT